MSRESTCPHCGAESVYQARDVLASGRAFPYGRPVKLLPDLGDLFTPPSFTVLVCADCGLTRFFADKEARSKLASSSRWANVS